MELIKNNQGDLFTISEKNWIEENKKITPRDKYANLSLTLYISMVYGFAINLPYSIDIEQPEYVPADFLNKEPLDVDTNNWFKWNDRRIIFNAMTNWRDTFKSGMLLQVCHLFQKMILGQITNEYELTETEYANLGFGRISKEQEYNSLLFEILKTLPNYYNKIINLQNAEERRKVLEQFYNEITQKIAARVGGSAVKEKIDNVIDVIRSSPTIILEPSKDVELLVYSERINYFDGIPTIIEAIKKEQLRHYKSQYTRKIHK